MSDQFWLTKAQLKRIEPFPADARNAARAPILVHSQMQNADSKIDAKRVLSCRPPLFSMLRNTKERLMPRAKPAVTRHDST